VGTSRCSGTSPGLKGAYGLEQALDRLLAGADCGWRRVDATTVEIRAKAAARAVPPGSTQVSEVRVTALKREALAIDTPAAISVVDHETIRANHDADVGDTIGQVAALAETNLGPGRDKLIARGLSDGVFTGRARATVESFLDDLPINYDAPDPDLRLTDVDRIEVVRGPQGSLYGVGALTGVYRIVPRRPDLDHMAFGISGTAASTDGGAASGVVEGYANAPILSGRLGLRLAAYHEVQGGYLDDLDLHKSNVDTTTRDGGRVALRYQLAPAWTLDLGADDQYLKSNDTQYQPGPKRPRANRVQEGHGNSIQAASAALRGSLSDVDVTVLAGLVRHRFHSIYDASAALDVFGASDSELGIYTEGRRVQMSVEEATFASKPSTGRLNWLAGVYAAQTLEGSPSMLTAKRSGVLTSIYQEDRTDHISETAAYGQVTYELFRGWTLAAGARLFDTRLKVMAGIQVAPPGRSRDLAKGLDYKGVSPEISLQHELAGGGLIYTLLSTGTRAGGFNSGGLTPPAASRAEYGADQLANLEFGAKFTAFDGRLRNAGALFVDRWRNIQTDQYLSSGLAFTANVGDATVVGLEDEADLRVAQGLVVGANLLLTRSRLDSENPAFAPTLTNSLPGSAPVSGGFWAGYERPLKGEFIFQSRLQVAYIGRSHLNFDATSPTMGGYIRADITAGVRWRRITADLYVTNPTNASGDTFAFGNPFSFGQVRQVTPLRPRTVGLILSASY
jgi:outer membrane receptor protein involved in Fe transport